MHSLVAALVNYTAHELRESSCLVGGCLVVDLLHALAPCSLAGNENKT